MRTGRVSLNPQWDERGVSPVLGMVMVLAISVVGTVSVMTWGLPAIDEMKANVEVQSVKGQLEEFLSDVQELVAGTAGKTAKRWQPSLQRGELYVTGDTHPWIIAVDKRSASDWNFEWAHGTEPNSIVVSHQGVGSITGAVVNVYSLSGSSESDGKVSDLDGAPDNVVEFGGDTDWAPGESVTLYLFNSDDSELNLAGNAIRLTITGGTDEVYSEAWFLEAGDTTFELNAGVARKQLFVSNGALFQGQEDNYVLLNPPPIPAPKVTGGANRLFMRFVELDGAEAFAGQHRHDVLLTLQSTAVREDLDCPSTDASDDSECAERVKLYPLGDRSAEWRNYFTSSANGYGMTETTNDASWDSASTPYVLHEPSESRATFTLIHSLIEVSN